MTSSGIKTLETKLDEIFGKSAPKLPEGGKKFIVQWAPIVSLIIGILTLLSVWGLWHWAHVATYYANYTAEFCNAYHVQACSNMTADRMTLWIWLSLVFLLIQGVLYLAAYSGLKAHKKQGWNYIFYGALLNVAYAVLTLFSDYDKVGHFLGAVIGSSIAFYLLFQVRPYYLGKTSTAPAVHKDHNDEK